MRLEYGRKWRVAAAGIGVAALLGGCKREEMPMQPRPPAAVTVTTAVARDVPVYIDEIGQTAASEFVNIQPQVTGQITKRPFEDGSYIKTGDLLFAIDPRMYQAQVEQAQANLEQGKAQLELAQAELARYEKAYKVGAASVEDYDAKKGAFDTATAQVKVGVAALDTAKLNLSYCTINSPIDGRAGQRMMDEGNIVKANETTLLAIQRITPMYVNFTITERDLPEVRQRMEAVALKARVSLPQTPGVSREGTLTFLDTNVQQAAGRIRLQVTLENKDRYFWPGQFVNVRLVLREIKGAVLLPYRCTQVGQQGPYVYVVKADKTAEQRSVTLGQRQGGDDDLVVVSKVKAGEQVVLTGQLSVSPGGEVAIVPEAAAPSTAPASAPASAPANTSQPSTSRSAGGVSHP